MGLGGTIHVSQDVLEIELIKPEQITSRKANKVVRTYILTCFTILP